MKKLLLILIISSCTNKSQQIVIQQDSAQIVLEKADSVLEQHNRVKERNLKVLNEVIEKYCASQDSTIKDK